MAAGYHSLSMLDSRMRQNIRGASAAAAVTLRGCLWRLAGSAL